MIFSSLTIIYTKKVKIDYWYLSVDLNFNSKKHEELEQLDKPHQNK